MIPHINVALQVNLKSPYELETNMNTLSQLAGYIGLEKAPLRIESYDISNISGSSNVGVMIVFRNGTLRASFFRDIWRVERVRRNFNLREIALFKQVLIEGKSAGLFEVDNVDVLADILHYCVKGIEVPYIRGRIGGELSDREGWEYVAKIVYGALGHKSTKTNS